MYVECCVDPSRSAYIVCYIAVDQSAIGGSVEVCFVHCACLRATLPLKHSVECDAIITRALGVASFHAHIALHCVQRNFLEGNAVFTISSLRFTARSLLKGNADCVVWVLVRRR